MSDSINKISNLAPLLEETYSDGKFKRTKAKLKKKPLELDPKQDKTHFMDKLNELNNKSKRNGTI